MNTHLSEDELILHYYGETDRARRSRASSRTSRRARSASPPSSNCVA